MKVERFNPLPSKEDCLSAIDDLRAKIEDGSVVAFAAIGIEPNDVVTTWIGSSRPTTRLKILGAVHNLAYYVQTVEW